MKKERIVIATQTGKSNNHHFVFSTIHVIEYRTMVWIYQDSAKDSLLEGGDGECIRIHIKCGSVTDDNSHIIRHVSVMENYSQSKIINSNGRNKIYNILKWILKLAGRVIIELILIYQQLH